MNVSLLMGGVHHPESYAFQLQNLTTQPFGGLSLGPGEALTLPYAFTLAPQLGGGPNPRYTRACPALWTEQTRSARGAGLARSTPHEAVPVSPFPSLSSLSLASSPAQCLWLW